MKNNLKSEFIVEEKHTVAGIPIIRLYPKGCTELIPTIIFYHGWSSNKESQRLRSFILNILGFQVLIPESINHGERGIIDYNDVNNIKNYFWPTILTNIEESEEVLEYAVNVLKADPNKLGVTGHSMGGFTAAGVYVRNEQLKALVVLNGSCNWSMSNSIFQTNFGIELSEDFKKLENKINIMDPNNNLDSIIDRPILMINGGSDNVVDPKPQRKFYNIAKASYKDKSLIGLLEYTNLGHFVTTNMMEDTALWFKRFL